MLGCSKPPDEFFVEIAHCSGGDFRGRKINLLKMMNRRIELVLFIELRTYIVEVEFVQNLPDIRREDFFVIDDVLQRMLIADRAEGKACDVEEGGSGSRTDH